jgi:hypothetical protein
MENNTVQNEKEAVNHPSHYNSGKIETIDAIEDWGFGQGFNLGNVIKYVSRANHKNDCIEDLNKARWYLDREIKRLSTPTQSLDAYTSVEVKEILDKVEVDTCTIDNVDDDFTFDCRCVSENYQFPRLTKDVKTELNEWYKRHNNGRCCRAYKGAIGGSITFSVTPTSIGDFVTALCPMCSEEITWEEMQ